MEASIPIPGARKPRGARTDALLIILASVAPAVASAAHASNVADAAHDEGTVRAVGLGFTGAWRALDAALSAIFMTLPIGTRSMRASLACALAAGLLGGVLYRVTRRLLAACADAPRFGAVIACVASLTAMMGAPIQLESASPGGSVLGAVLALLPLALALRVPAAPGESIDLRVDRLPVAAFVTGLAFTYEIFAGLAALAALVALTLATWKTSRSGAKESRVFQKSLLFAFLGLAPAILVMLRSRGAHVLTTGASPLAAWLGEPGASKPLPPLTFLQDEIGLFVAALALVGAGLAVLVPRARALALALLAMGFVGVASTAAGVPAGPTRYGAPVLAAVVATLALAGVAMQAVVRLVARANVPFARASASMVVLLELTFPVHTADESFARALERARGAAAGWEDVAYGALPAGAVLLVNDTDVMSHALASRAAGELRGDLAIVPTYDLAGRTARRELAREPALAPFWRDMALHGQPQEFALSALASARPLAVVYDTKWDRTLARHLVPSGLFERFETEPRGLSDRKKALDAFTAKRNRLRAAIAEPLDAELVALSTKLLRARATALVASGDKEVVARGIEDLRVFAPNDTVATQVAKRVALKP